jgi:hypothetical protein
MNGIYLTQEGKQEIEAKIAELEKYKDSDNCKDPRDWSFVSGKQAILKEILSSSTILPVEESFYTVENKLKYHCGRTGCSKDGATLREYPNGVIIQPKKQNL